MWRKTLQKKNVNKLSINFGRFFSSTWYRKTLILHFLLFTCCGKCEARKIWIETDETTPQKRVRERVVKTKHRSENVCVCGVVRALDSEGRKKRSNIRWLVVVVCAPRSLGNFWNLKIQLWKALDENR